MVPYAAGGPDWAIVLPSRIELLVTPTSVWAVVPVDPPQAARAMKRAVIPAIRDPNFVIELPTAFMETYLNSLGVRWHLSSLPIRDPPEPPAQAAVPGKDEADHPVGRKNHGQDQHGAIGDRRTRLLDGRRDRARDPGLGWDPLVRLDREGVREYAADD